MKSFRLAVVYLSIIVSISCAAFTFGNEEEAALKRIRRYTKRQAEGNCMYNMCNETEGYPAEDIKMLVEKQEAFKELFGTVVQPFNKEFVESRFLNEEENMCSSHSVFMVPKRALDINDEWRTIVNVGEYKQIVEFEACSEGAKCFAGEHIPDKTTTCQQSNVTLKMIAFNGVKELVSESFPIPSGCVCKYSTD